MRERKQRGGGGFLARQITGKQGKVRCRKKKGRKVGEGGGQRGAFERAR